MEIICSPDLITSPLVSIVIPSYNRAETVGFTIESIINQICSFNFEIVIGDDCSTDNAREILLAYQKKYPEQITLLFYKQNIGLGANWATCVKCCRGKYLANCDNDDYWHNPNKLQLQVDFLESNLQYGVVHTDFRRENRITGKVTDITVSNLILEKPIQNAFYDGKFKVCNATMMYRKDLIDKYVNLDDYLTYQFTLQDWTTWVILAHYTDFFCMPVSTATICMETESITRPKSYEQLKLRFQKEKECRKYLGEKFSGYLTYSENDYDIYIHKVLLNFAYKKFDFKSARKFANILNTLGYSDIKTKSAGNIISFTIFCILKKIR